MSLARMFALILALSFVTVLGISSFAPPAQAASCRVLGPATGPVLVRVRMRHAMGCPG